LVRADRALIAVTGRLVVTGDIRDDMRDKPLLLAANHIGNFDPLVLAAACARIRLAPRFLIKGELFDTPGLGRILRAGGHLRTDRGTAAGALDRVTAALREDHRPVLGYPEGRISLEPGLWPEHGKTGIARMALAAHAAVVPVSQWGANEAMCYGMTRVQNGRDLWTLFASWLRALPRRPTMTVHFGPSVDLGDLSAEKLGDAARARDRIMREITGGLAPLRTGEPDTPRFHDPTRPRANKRSPWIG
jgi:1-acyl-sn-glycerol-3-phosphate acyltransferase